MADLDVELAAYLIEKPELEKQNPGNWVVFRKDKRVGLFATFEAAATEAVKLFGRGPYLIRQIGAPPVALPICIVQRRDDGTGQLRL